MPEPTSAEELALLINAIAEAYCDSDEDKMLNLLTRGQIAARHVLGEPDPLEALNTN